MIGARIDLKPCGREFIAHCPFHDEGTPSFYVIPHKMKSNGRGLPRAYEEGVDGLENIGAQVGPVVGLRDNRLCQALGHKTTVRLLRYLENNLIHCRFSV